MIKRSLQPKILESLAWNSAVAILGPRQAGKTTLALEIGKHLPSLYLDMESPQDRQRLQNPAAYLGTHSDKLVILDEVQQYPDLFMSLRGVIDEGRRQGRGNGRFLILGSASNDLLHQSSESLAGRIQYMELAGLSPLEVMGLDEETDSASNQDLTRLWLRGGFPSSYGAGNDRQSLLWRSNFIRTYLERDIPTLGPRIPSETLMRFWTMLAHCQGEIVNASKLATALGVSSVTISRYIDLMVDLLLVRRLQPWAGNVKKRLVKMPRLYVRDSGVVHALLNIKDYDELLGHPVCGKSWEGFVIENILNMLPSHVQPFFYRTTNGAEIDLVLELAPNKLWAIEIKASHVPKLERGFYAACQDLPFAEKFVVYAGHDEFPIKDDVTVTSLAGILHKVGQL
jgi:predicted AAA+ superfamily ATPase